MSVSCYVTTTKWSPRRVHSVRGRNRYNCDSRWMFAWRLLARRWLSCNHRYDFGQTNLEIRGRSSRRCCTFTIGKFVSLNPIRQFPPNLLNYLFGLRCFKCTVPLIKNSTRNFKLHSLCAFHAKFNLLDNKIITTSPMHTWSRSAGYVRRLLYLD